jgi:NADPH:quinone reductase
MTRPATMQAAVLESHGAPFRLATIPRPAPGPGQVLVRIAASGTNPLDTKIHAGAAAHARHPLPAILGLDLAGTVAALGDGATRFRHGDEVYGMTGGVGGHQGSLAGYAAVDADLLALKPANLGMRDAAALPLVFITAWEGLVDRAAVRSGQTVLVQGGAGGVGQMVVQIARAFGAKVFATGSPSSRTAIERLGASFVDRSEPVADYVARLTGGSGFDLVYDTAGGAALDASFAAVNRLWPRGELSRLGNACPGPALLQGGHLLRGVHPPAAADRRRPRAPWSDSRRGDSPGRGRQAGAHARPAPLHVGDGL